MPEVDFAFFALATLLVLAGGIITVGAKNPIRGAMGLLTTILGIAGMYLLLAAEFLAAIQVLVYAGAVVVLFLFVIMLLGPSATSGRDARTAIPRYSAAILFGLTATFALAMLARLAPAGPLAKPGAARPGLGTIEALGHELFTTRLVPFELSGALLLVAVVGAVAVARGKQVDPTLLPAPDEAGKKPAPKAAAAAPKEAHS